MVLSLMWKAALSRICLCDHCIVTRRPPMVSVTLAPSTSITPGTWEKKTHTHTHTHTRRYYDMATFRRGSGDLWAVFPASLSFFLAQAPVPCPPRHHQEYALPRLHKTNICAWFVSNFETHGREKKMKQHRLLPAQPAAK